MKNNFLLPALLLSAFSLTAPIAQETPFLTDDDFLGDYVSQTWTSSDGLPGNTITSILQDSQGYINIGTYGGLVKFDGIDFSIYNKGSNSRFNFISARTLFLDSQNNMWVGANDEGVTFISANGQTVIQYTKDSGLPGNSVRTICEDHERNIWVGTSSGVAYISEEGKVFIPNGLSEYEGDTPGIVKLFCDSAGRIWLATSHAGGLYYYQNERFFRYNGIKSFSNAYVTEISQEKNGALWYGISPHYAVRIFNGTEKVYNLGFGEQKATVVNTIYQDSNSQIWFALDTGAVILHDGVLSSYTLKNGLSDKNLNAIIEDREGNIWLGTDRGGLQKLTLSRFKTVSLPTSINAIAEDTNQGLVWMGADNGLYCYDSTMQRVNNKWTEYCANVRIRHVELTRDGSLLVSTYANFGQLKLSPDGKITMWRDELTGQKVRVAIEAKNGDIYIGTTTGLNVVDGITGKIKRQYTRNDGFTNDYIMALFQDEEENIWCGTDGGGIVILDKEGNITKTLTKEDDGLSGNVIFKIAKLSPADEIWISTGTGISRYKNGELFSFSSASGFGSDGIFQMIEDYTGTVWMTSNTGISSVPLSDLEKVAEGKATALTAKFYNKNDGIRSDGTTSTSLSMKDSVGRIWFTLIDGFAVYDPVKIMNNPIPPSVVITEINIDGQKYAYEELASSDIILEPGTQRFSINFTGLSFISPEQMEFCFMLDGFEQHLSDWTTTRTVSYTNLKPGTYQFKLRARTGEDVTSDILQSVRIVKKPYFWQLWYFWLALGLLVMAAVFFTIFHRFRRMKRYQETLEKTVQERTEDLRNTNHELEIEKGKSEALLLKIFPKEVAKTLTETPDAMIAESYPMATVLFADIVGFTKLSSELDASTVVSMLNQLFSKFDERARTGGIEKIKTIGDCYMAACGLYVNDRQGADEASKMIEFAKGLLADVAQFNLSKSFNIQIRIGINTGALVAGVIGKTKFLYDIWGDTVNVASRMESSGKAGQIHVTEVTKNLTEENCSYGEASVIEIKGKGKMKTYFLA